MADNGSRYCPDCTAQMDVVDDLGVSTYWRCGEHAPPVVVLPPPNVGYAGALVRSRILDPYDAAPDEEVSMPVTAPGLEQFDADRPGAPARFVDRVFERITTLQTSIVDHARTQAANRDGAPTAKQESEGMQAGLDTF